MKNIWSKENQERIILEHQTKNPHCKECHGEELYGLGHLFLSLVIVVLTFFLFFV